MKMLTGNPAKYLSIILGIAFAALLISQQASIFLGLMRLTGSQIRDVQGAEVWVMDPNVRFVDDIKPVSTNDLQRVRGVKGVDWAVRFYKGLSRARLPDGNFQQVILLGLDDGSMVGAPQEILIGSLADLRIPDAIIMDDAGFQQLWPSEPLAIGKTFEMNDRRAVLVGVCKASRTFQTFPVVYSRYSQATLFVPPERKIMSFILLNAQPGVDLSDLCRRIRNQTGLAALTKQEFIDKTFNFYWDETGIPINFGITVLLGFIVGTAVSGQTFYLFTIENLKQFGALKAMGTSNPRIAGMVLSQAIVVGLIGYGLGVGVAGIFGHLTRDVTKLAFFMTWEILLLTGAAVVLMVVLSSLLCVRRVLVVEPAIVFQG